MEPEYLYVLDVGATFGPRLERLAAREAETDVEAFAAMLLRGAIEQLERQNAEEEQSLTLPPVDHADGEADDLPF